MTAHDSGWRWWLAFFLLPDSHRLHWHQLAWRTVISPFSATDPEFGARQVRVRGHAKVLCHLMFGIVAPAVSQLMRLLN